MLYAEDVCGSMEFTPEEVKSGKMTEFVGYLVSMQCEIRLWTDDYCYIVEYLQRFRKDDGWHFDAICDQDLIDSKNVVDFLRELGKKAQEKEQVEKQD